MKNDEFDSLRQDYLKSLPDKFRSIQAAIEKLRRSSDMETLKELRIAVHKMASMAGIYGYPAVSEICRRWDSDLSKMIESFPACKKDMGWLDDFERNFATVKQEFSRG